MARRTSSTPEVLLGLLSVESMSGYDIGQTIQSSIRYIWNESYGQIYPTLKQLAAGGFITGKVEKQKGKPDRRVYSITAKGRERLARWLAVDPQPEIPRNELLLKMFFGSQTGAPAVSQYVERLVERESAILRHFEDIGREIAAHPQYPDAPYWRMVLRFGQIELEAHLRWAQETRSALQKLTREKTPSASARKERPHVRK